MNLSKILIFTLILFTALNNITNAQGNSSVIEGRVLEESTGAPLQNVNVYISGTTWGAATDKSGYFAIKSLPAGSHEIVASMIGYEPETKNITIKDNAAYTIEFKLKDATYELQSVVVAAQSSEEWRLNYEIFKKRFLGETKFAADCKIENPEFINLDWISPNLLVATSNKQIEVVNNALGYKISCQLEKFIWDKNLHQIKLEIRPLFIELTDSTRILKQKWQANRKEAYKGSLDQFLRSTVNNTVEQKGFRISIDLAPLMGNNYLRYLDQPLVKKDGDDFLMSFTKYLKVEYRLNDPLHPEVSWIRLVTPQVTLDKWGYPLEREPFEIYGFWSQRGIADMLPKYFAEGDSL
jgi:hypothetical protein